MIHDTYATESEAYFLKCETLAAKILGGIAG